MVNPRTLNIKLLSDTTFAKGQETPGIVDVEVEHDELGVPFLGGKTLHGLLRDNYLSIKHNFSQLDLSFVRVFGLEKDTGETCILRISDARLQPETVEWINYAVHRRNSPIPAQNILSAMTSIRTQTSINESTGAPEEGSLRTSRVVNRETELIANLTWLKTPDKNDIRCLALAAAATRHGGWGRNRGRGHLQIMIDGDSARTFEIARGGK